MYRALSSATMQASSVTVAFSKTKRAGVNRSEFSAFKYRAAMRQYSGSISTPMLLRPVFRAAVGRRNGRDARATVHGNVGERMC